MAQTDLKSAYDREGDGDVLLKGKASPRPKDAATLMLVRRDGPQPTVLMGKRSGRHAFMPDKYVFPGGRVDRLDGRAKTLTELDSACEAKLRKSARRLPRALALTAIRETFEETGLIVGKAAEIEGPYPPGWESFYKQGAAPCLTGLTFFGRAVTPPYRPRRFDARFFYGFAEDLLIDERPPMDGAELTDLQWVTLEDAMALDLPSVTRFMLGEMAERLDPARANRDPAFLRWTRSGHSLERL
ncbi:MAG: NUDIX domain-containing protein [Hyphomonadaceae bacterium]|nr:NUDIX domain-containing protein [Hyphomonadaceae bacterium]